MNNSWDLDWVRKYVLPIARLTKTSIEGLEHIPKRGKVLFCPTHGGWLPLDDLLSYSIFVDRLGENIPAFINPLLFKLPGFGLVMRKIGALSIKKIDDIKFLKSCARCYFMAPEGADGSTKPFYRAYDLRSFRPGFIKMGIKLRAKILPIVSIGNEDIFPVFFRIDKLKDIIGTSVGLPFTLFPLPLSRIQVKIFPPIDLGKYDLALADDRDFCMKLAEEIRTRQQRRVNLYARNQPLFKLSKLKKLIKDYIGS